MKLPRPEVVLGITAGMVIILSFVVIMIKFSASRTVPGYSSKTAEPLWSVRPETFIELLDRRLEETDVVLCVLVSLHGVSGAPPITQQAPEAHSTLPPPTGDSLRELR